jgi:hypothetical protein
MDVMVKSGRRRVGIFSRMDAGRVIDLPAGTGGDSHTLERLGYWVCAVDLFPA